MCGPDPKKTFHDKIDATCFWRTNLHRGTFRVKYAVQEQKEYFTPEEVAERFRVPHRTILGMCADGKFAGAVKLRAFWRIPCAAVEALAVAGGPHTEEAKSP